MNTPDAPQIAALQKIRKYYFETLTEAANEIAAIDREIAIMKSQELEADLLQSENR
jgi:hypothetical protein